jgi:hypothetical protein
VLRLDPTEWKIHIGTIIPPPSREVKAQLSIVRRKVRAASSRSSRGDDLPPARLRTSQKIPWLPHGISVWRVCSAF